MTDARRSVNTPSWLRLLREGARVTGHSFRGKVALTAGLSLLISLLDVVGLALMLPLTRHLASEGRTGAVEFSIFGETSLGYLLLAIATFFLAKSLFSTLLRWKMTGIVVRANVQTTIDLLDAYLRAPLDFHDERHSAQQVRSMYSSVNMLFTYGYLAVVILATEMATIVLLLVVMLVVAPIGALSAIGFFGFVSAGYLLIVQPRTRKAARQLELAQARALGTMQEGLGGLREYRVRGSEAVVAASFSAHQQEVGKSTRLISFLNETPRYYLEAAFAVGLVVLAWTTVGTADSGNELPTLALLATLSLRSLPSVSRILASSTNINFALAALDTLNDDLAAMGLSGLERVAANEPTVLDRGPKQGPARLELVSVGFRYGSSDTAAVTDVGVTVEPGRSLGLIGPSGAGKSTMLDLICGLRSPTSGHVLIDGEDATVARARIGLVAQEVFILDADVRTNVAFGFDVDDDEVWRALEEARIADHIRSLPEGLDTILGERGSRFSGGQRQRIGIARALYASPSLLVLDEATSALDSATEADVVRSLGHLSGKVTMIVVTHRLSTVQGCDRIACLDGGRLIAEGPYEEVSRRLGSAGTPVIRDAGAGK